MKNDLVTSIVVAIVGVVGAYLVCNIFSGEIEPISVKTVDSSMGVEVAEPNPEVFNYKAINPTVEVYIGNENECQQYDPNGNCIYEDNQGSPDSNPGQGE
jgi:hypothetical protein